MNGTVQEGVEKAEGDFDVAQLLLRRAGAQHYDIVCFHAQQAVEKLMKAVLIRRKVLPPRTHDLVLLDELLRRAVADWSWDEEQLRTVSRASIVFRYPGKGASRREAVRAMKLCEKIWKALLRYA